MQNKKACNKQFSNNYSSYSQLQEINKDKINNKNKANLKYISFQKYTCDTIIKAVINSNNKQCNSSLIKVSCRYYVNKSK